MPRFENPVGADQINQAHALELRVVFHRNHDEGKNEAGLGEVLL